MAVRWSYRHTLMPWCQNGGNYPTGGFIHLLLQATKSELMKLFRWQVKRLQKLKPKNVLVAEWLQRMPRFKCGSGPLLHVQKKKLKASLVTTEQHLWGQMARTPLRASVHCHLQQGLFKPRKLAMHTSGFVTIQDAGSYKEINDSHQHHPSTLCAGKCVVYNSCWCYKTWLKQV